MWKDETQQRQFHLYLTGATMECLAFTRTLSLVHPLVAFSERELAIGFEGGWEHHEHTHYYMT